VNNFLFGKLSGMLREQKLEPIIDKLAVLYNDEFFKKRRRTYIEKELKFIEMKTKELYDKDLLEIEEFKIRKEQGQIPQGQTFFYQIARISSVVESGIGSQEQFAAMGFMTESANRCIIVRKAAYLE
jgi:hypothetical protein